MATVLMGIVLSVLNRPSAANLTSHFVGILIAQDILFLAPVSGFSINPAPTTVWTAEWLYFIAPLGMMFAA